MVLEARLKKLATGVTAEKAAAAHAQRARDPDSLSDEQRSLADEFDAIVEGMFLMAAVDGEVSDEEIGQLEGSVHAVLAMHGVEGEDTFVTLAKLNDLLDSEGWTARLKAVAARLPSNESRLFALKLAAGVAFVDDHVAHAEAAGIESFAKELGVDADASQRVLREVHEALFD